jgi:hypothetical protein
MEIPKIIHLTYKTHNYPEHILAKWKKLNPDYTFTYSDNTDCYNFINHHFSKEYADFFNRIVHGPNKADFWRLCKLYIEGGVYTDIDIEPIAPIKNIILNSTLCSCIAMDNSSIFQAFLATTPKNVVIKSCIQSFVKNAFRMNMFKLCGNNCGPTVDMYNVLKQILKRRELKPNVIYNLKSGTANISHRILLFREIVVIPSKGLDGIYVKNHRNQLILKSRFDGFIEWKKSIDNNHNNNHHNNNHNNNHNHNHNHNNNVVDIRLKGMILKFPKNNLTQRNLYLNRADNKIHPRKLLIT